MSIVLVTGGSGFVGSHVIIKLLKAGHSVRTTVRDLKRQPDVRKMLAVGGVQDSGSNLSFFAADLTNDAGWNEATEGCEYVMHVASPFPIETPKHEDELIIPAREGTLRVLRAARDCKVKRVVITSSFAAIGYGQKEKHNFDENDWTDVTGSDVQPYTKSKTLAERAAWDFIEKEGNGLELSVVNPVGIFGPALGPDFSSSIGIIKQIMDGALPAAPRIYFGAVDVRDVADLHVLAMTAPQAKGERFLAIAGAELSVLDAAKILRNKFGKYAAKAPKSEMPDWLMKVMVLFVPKFKDVVPQLGVKRTATHEKATRMLGWSPLTNEECIIASGQSLIDLGLLKS
ncbi:aldehyde reductase [soil metagenome]